MQIHPTAVIEEGASIGQGTSIGPFSVIGPQVKLGENCIIHSHVTIDGNTSIGSGNEIYPYACIGKQTQDKKYTGGNPGLTIGNNNTIREYVTISCATDDGDYTVIGDNCSLLAYSHVAHDCIFQNDIVISSGALISGHVEIGNSAVISGMTGVIQFIKIGEFAFVGGYSKVVNDVPPYCIADGIPATIASINKIGLDRKGFSKPEIKEIYRAYKSLFRSDQPLDEVTKQLAQVDSTHVKNMLDFITSSTKGISRKTN